MSKKIINAPDAPPAVGPYSHSILAGNIQFISGQLGLDPATGQLKETVEEQAVQALENLGKILKAAGMDYSNVVKTTVFLQEMSDFPSVNKIYEKYFPENPPARSCVAVKTLPLNGLYEVEAIAVKC
jgi:2-iminobutanoate/2-iminopropanoate deaminase